MSCSAVSGSKRPSGMTSFTPASIPTTRLQWQPDTWNSGEVRRPTVWPPPPIGTAAASASAMAPAIEL